MKQVSVKRNFIYSTVYQILLIILPFITAPYVSRVLGADGMGIYGFTWSVQAYFTMFAALGTAIYGMRAVARVRDDRTELTQTFWEIEILSILTTLFCTLVWAGFIIFTQQYRIYYIVLSTVILSTLFDISWFYQGIEHFEHIVLQNTICKVLGTAAIFIFVREKDDLWVYILIVGLTTLLANISMWIYLKRYADLRPVRKIRLGKHFKETIIYFIPTIATSVYTVLDRTLIGVITHSEVQNGYYEQATKVINIAKALTFGSLNAVLGSRISYLFTGKKYEEIHSRIVRSMSYILLMGTGFMFGIIGTAKTFVPVFFGEGYEGSIILLRIFAPIILIIGISNCLETQYFNPAGLRAKSAVFVIVGAVVNLGLNLLLIPRLQSVGAAIASVAAEIVITILYMVFCGDYMTVRILWRCFWKRLIAGCIMFACIQLIALIPVRPLISLILQILVGILVYGIVLILLKDRMLLEVSGKVLGRLLPRRQA